MSVYVDDMKAQFRGMTMCHMMADTLDELHAMAKILGLKRQWFQDKPRHPHYDIALTKRRLAIENGAVELSMMDIVRKTRGVYVWDKENGTNIEKGKEV